MKVLLDTHTFIWLYTTPEKLSKTAMEICQDTDNQLYLSMASLWEMQIKVQLGKLKLKISLADMLTVQQQENDLNVLNIALAHIYQLQALPFHHNDPFDRLIIAQSVLENMTLISVDEKFKAYDVSVLW
jgi:PIN domain nuclease of toxin-antitoxin system